MIMQTLWKTTDDECRMKKRRSTFDIGHSTLALLLGLCFFQSPWACAQQPLVVPPGPSAPLGAAGEAVASDSNPSGPYFRVTGNDDHLKMVVNSSRFLILDKRIPQVQVNNPEILNVVPMSPTLVQISARRTGVTQVNLWGEDKKIYTVNVIVMGDAAELAEMLRTLFPKATLTVVPINGASVIISGYVEQQDIVPKIHAVAAKYFPEVIDNMLVSGTQQGVVHIKVVEVSRTKMRNMGFDWASVSSTGNVVWSGVNGLLSTASGSPFGGPGAAPDNVFKFNIGSLNAFYGVLNALREDDLGKILSEPDVMAISGRPAYVMEGGELGYQVTNALSGTMVGFKEYGTRLDIVPILLGNGRMHIDVRINVSQPDAANSINGIPALKSRGVETGVELRSGQTLAIAGLIESRTEATVHGFPWISEIPYLGTAFRSETHSVNEVELLVLLTPEIVDGMEPGQVPTCLPGSNTTDPTDWELFFKGLIEVPNCCPADGTCQQCNPAGAGAAPGLPAPPSPAIEVVPPGRQNQQIPPVPNQVAANQRPAEPGFIGPIGYDVLK
jgi:pilus assembly protein CpaC